MKTMSPQTISILAVCSCSEPKDVVRRLVVVGRGMRQPGVAVSLRTRECDPAKADFCGSRPKQKCYTGGKRREVRYETLLDFRGAGAVHRRVLSPDSDHRDVGISGSAQPLGSGEAVRGVSQDASIQLSVRYPAGTDDRRGG